MNRIVWLATGIFLLVSPVLAWTQHPNDCSDPFWEQTLRCQNAADPSTLVPQPAPDSPVTTGQLKDFTRVPLDDDDTVRCLDGTVPVLYIDEAVDGPSNNWLFTFSGGGSCSAQEGPGGDLTDGNPCLEKYRSDEATEMGTSSTGAMKNLGRGGGGSKGIHSPDPSQNPVFARFNRVRVQKCSYSRYNGRSTRGVSADHPNKGTIDYELFQHGALIVHQALRALRAGLEYQTWVPDGAGGVDEVTRTLPELRDAQRVVFVGHSGAAHGLMHTADRIRGVLESWTQFGGEVRVVLDANFLEALENEASFNEPAPTGDLYDHQTTGSSLAVAPVSGVYDQWYWSDPDSTTGVTYRSWSANGDPATDIHDSSCVAAHAGEEWRCADRFHVLFNHLATAVLVREDLSDPNSEHTAGGQGQLVKWGEWGDYAHCISLAGFTPCPPLIDLASHHTRILQQHLVFRDEAAARAELVSSFVNPGQGAPADPTAGGVLPTRYLFHPDCASHNGVFEDGSYLQTLVATDTGTRSLRQLVEEFVMEAPLTGMTESWAVDVDGATAMCPPAQGAGASSGLGLVAEADGSLTLSWAPSCVASDTDYNVYEGSLGDFSSHRLRTCTTSGATSYTLDPSGDLQYYLVVPQNGQAEGSYGEDSFGIERSQGPHVCFPQLAESCAP